MFRLRGIVVQLLGKVTTNVNDLLAWVETGNFGLRQSLTPSEVVDLGPALVDRIYYTFRRVFPVYLWAIADEPEQLIEQYLEAEFPLEMGKEDEEEDDRPEPYTKEDFLSNTCLLPERLDELIDLLHDKRQIVLYGPPGTGKTWVAERLGKLLTGLADPPSERMTVVQFHPAYSYEEFIEGIRPQRIETQSGSAIDYQVRPGAFVRFCRMAARLGDKPCVFLIDEINRGNIPRIFGELMLLLEYREKNVLLPYSGDKFSIPKNVYIIGTMNTADRSIALVDFALRRRFHFFDFPADPALFERWLAANPSPGRPAYLAELYRCLAEEAIEDENFRIGPSYFMRKDMTETMLKRIWQRSIMPYLREYHFDRQNRADMWAWDGEKVRSIREG